MKLGGYLEMESFIKHVDAIISDCQPILKELTKQKKYIGSFLYSGRERSETFFTGKVRKNRKPKDTNPEISNDFDKAFAKKFGYPARSNSMFCVGTTETASDYGHAFMIFPKGNYKFLWSKEVRDLYTHIRKEEEDSHSLTFNILLKSFVNNIDNQIKQDLYQEYLGLYEEGGDNGHYVYFNREEGGTIYVPMDETGNAKTYVTGKLQDADNFNIMNLTWVPDMIYSEYFDTNWSSFSKKAYEEENNRARTQYDEWIEGVVDTYQSTDLTKALTSGSEIMLNCGSYYAWTADMAWLFEMYLRKFGIKPHKSKEEIERWYINEI